MGVEHDVVYIDFFCVLTADVFYLCVLVCVNFEDKIMLRGEECKTRKKFNISEKWKNGNFG